MVSYLQLALEYPSTVNRIWNFKPAPTQELLDFAFDKKNRIIAPAQKREEISGFLNYISTKNIKNVLEIGSANGGTLFLISRTVNRNAKLISLDFGYTKFAGLMLLAKRILFNSFSPEGTVALINGDSHKDETCVQVIREMRGALDLLFIDGDHRYEGVKQDFEMYSPLVKTGGLIVFHDIVKHASESDCNVKKFWDEIKDNYEHTEFIKDPEQEGFGIGALVYSSKNI